MPKRIQSGKEKSSMTIAVLQYEDPVKQLPISQLPGPQWDIGGGGTSSQVSCLFNNEWRKGMFTQVGFYPQKSILSGADSSGNKILAKSAPFRALFFFFFTVDPRRDPTHALKTGPSCVVDCPSTFIFTSPTLHRAPGPSFLRVPI